MSLPAGLKATPWDQRVFGFETFEIMAPDEALLAYVALHPGHYTVKTDPLADKALLHRHGFYYTDTLLVPYADRQRLHVFPHEAVSLDLTPDQGEMLAICHGTFRHGRFHRDFNIDPALADRRYDQWVGQLCDEGNAIGVTFEGETAAFFGVVENKMVLHAVAERYQGRGLAKYMWSRLCCELFGRGFTEICSSVSASNLAIVNLYASLGFRFRNPTDVYHRMVK